MNISLGAAVFPSTKRGRSPRMPGDSAAANRGVALSRVGKQLLQDRRRTGRQPCPPSPRVLRTCHAAAEVRRTSNTRNRRGIHDWNNSDATSRQGLWVHQEWGGPRLFLSPNCYLW